MQPHEAWLQTVIFFFITESIWYTFRNLRGSSKGIPALMGVGASPLNEHNVNDVFMQISCLNARYNGFWFATPTTPVYKRPQGSRAVHILQAKALLSSTSSTLDKMSYYYGNYYGGLGYGLGGLGCNYGCGYGSFRGLGCGYGAGYGGYGYGCYRPCYYGRYLSSSFYWETLLSTLHVTETHQPIFLF